MLLVGGEERFPWCSSSSAPLVWDTRSCPSCCFPAPCSGRAVQLWLLSPAFPGLCRLLCPALHRQGEQILGDGHLHAELSEHPPKQE